MKLDHLILGINDLEKGIDQFEQMTGIRAKFAGVHPGIGTHNALMALDDDMYFEIIAPQKPNEPLPGPFRGFEHNEELKVAGWVASCGLKDLDNSLSKLGIPHTPITPGSRTTPEGATIAWETIFMINGVNEVNINPFFIEWADTAIHPSQSNPIGLKLLEYEIAGMINDPFIDLIRSITPKCGLISTDSASAGSLLSITLDTPKGSVRFTS